MEKDIGKNVSRWVIISVFAAILLSILGWIYNAVTSIDVVFGGAVAIVLIAVLLIVAMRINPGKETFIDFLPVLLIVSAVVGLIGQVWVSSPFKFVVELTLLGLSIALSAVIFASAITNKVMKEIK